MSQAANEAPADRVSAAAEPDAVLALQDISKRFGGVQALKSVTFDVRAGEVHALLGENGAGKSTLMGITVGEIRADTGTLTVGGQGFSALTPDLSRKLGIGIVHQSPTLIPALTVLENMLLSVPAEFRGDQDHEKWAQAQLDAITCKVPLTARALELSIAHRQQVELAKALALRPRILILDEPTAALTSDMVEILFRKIREMSAEGVGIVYISHRMEEIRQVAQRVTIMRDGARQKVAMLDELSDDDILKHIVGRESHAVYPAKRHEPMPGGLVVRNLSGADFEDVSFEVPKGLIVGLAGITGNGQAGVLRSLAGLEDATGTIELNGRTLHVTSPTAAASAGISFMSSDRPNEGLVLGMSIRENAAVQSLARFARGGFLSGRAERDAVDEIARSLSVKTPDVETAVSSLSGGNQQKVVLARALLSRPQMILAEEPTAGVDIGARADIYHILRDAALDGTTVLVLSSDVAELEGICDQVYVFSRGRIVAHLKGEAVTQQDIGREIIQAPTTFRAGAQHKGAASPIAALWGKIRSAMSSDIAPAIVLAALVVVLSAYVFAVNPRFVSFFNIERILLLAAALALIGYGQLCVVLTGGLDLSVGPLVGLSVVIGSFFFADGSTALTIALGVALIFGVALGVGAGNGTLVQKLKFTPVAATLGVYTLLQGFAILLRPHPDGIIRSDLIGFVQASAFGIPAVFVLAVFAAATLELALRYTRWGMSIRAVGSDINSARKIGIDVDATVIGAYVLCSLFTAAGSLVVASQLGIGDANQGIEFTLASVAAVVLGGASLFGGRGSFVTVLTGALLLTVVERSMSFLGLSGAWQYWFLGGLILMAVTLYSKLKSR